MVIVYIFALCVLLLSLRMGAGCFLGFLAFCLGLFILCGGLGDGLSGMWMAMCAIFIVLGLIAGWDWRITFFVFLVLAIVQSFRHEPLFLPSVEDGPMYFVDPGGSYERNLNDEDWLQRPERATYKWINSRRDNAAIKAFLEHNDMTIEQLLEIGRRNVHDWNDVQYHRDERDSREEEVGQSIYRITQAVEKNGFLTSERISVYDDDFFSDLLYLRRQLGSDRVPLEWIMSADAMIRIFKPVDNIYAREEAAVFYSKGTEIGRVMIPANRHIFL